MKFILAPFGSRGDFDPFVALALKLKLRGHRVVLCAPANFRDAALSRGLEFQSAGLDFRTLFSRSRDDAEILRATLRHAREQFDAILSVSSGADVIIAGALQFGARSVSEILDVPYRYVIFSPVYLLSGELPPPGNRDLVLPAPLRRQRWLNEDREHLFSDAGRDFIALRKELKLPEPESLHFHLLGDSETVGAFDPMLTPQPREHRRVFVSGYWREKQNAELPPDMRDFLASGDAPIYLGFGSVTQEESRTLRSSCDVLLESGHRIVVARGWTETVSLPEHENVLAVDEVPHDLLLPRARACIHHGGAGTTVAAALAACPQIIIPQLGDQFYHAQRVQELGLGVQLASNKLNRDGIVSAVHSVLTSEVREQADVFARPMQHREASAIAAEYFEKVTN